MYKLSANMQELVAYELMSANDAPERDPMDWVVEGSNDGGSSWHVLDERRFRFLAVRDVKSTSRLQKIELSFFWFPKSRAVNRNSEIAKGIRNLD
ncbi:peptide-N(4)-(N-acetyl-beta-glucosaminyl)asparagine amidase-like isoform X3 [Gossypium australe]|uniref:Peptide-N(4)-(N-acetyl-beta-glucosaminyl)asparagine amidase-like isoform X3 n=1 Tax=Gossypium australe TaxID=47621 RepID=A0A5B6VU98_9ROSI|nr:peptide-N(4)-(N-acetyl-beta-glucosaminyl)asparagine amidase-like isoform X3 [Gossypium australe]